MNKLRDKALAALAAFIFILQIASPLRAQVSLLQNPQMNTLEPEISPDEAPEVLSENDITDNLLIAGQQTTLTAVSGNLVASEKFDSLGRLISDLDEQGIKTVYHYFTGNQKLKLAKLTFVIPKGILLPDGSELAAGKQIQVKLSDSFQIVIDPLHAGVIKSTFLDLLANDETVTGVTWELLPSQLEQNPSTSCDSSASSFECEFRLQGLRRGHYEYKVTTEIDLLGEVNYSADLQDQGLSEEHYDSLGRLSSDVDNQGIKTIYTYGTGVNKFKLTDLTFSVPADTLDTDVPPTLSTIRVDLKTMSISPDAIHSGVVKSVFIDLLERTEKVTGVIWELQPTRLEQNPSTSCNSAASSFECAFRIQGPGLGYYEYQVESAVDALGNASYSAFQAESGFAQDRYDKFGRLNFDIDNQGVKTTYIYGSRTNKFKVVKLIFFIPKGTVLSGGTVLPKAKGVQIKLSEFMTVAPDALHSGTVKSIVLKMMADGFFNKQPGGSAITGAWNLLPGHTGANQATSCTSTASQFQCEFRLENKKKFVEYRAQVQVDAQNHPSYSATLLQSGRILYDVHFNFLKGRKPFAGPQPAERFIFQQDVTGKVFLLNEKNGVLLLSPIQQNSFVLPALNAPYLLNVRVLVSNQFILLESLIHTGLIKVALLDMLAKGEKIAGIAWVILPTRAQHQLSGTPSCASTAALFTCDFRLEGKPKFFEYRVAAKVLSIVNAAYTVTQLANGLIANAPLTYQKFRKDGRIIDELDEFGIRTRYFYHPKTNALIKLVFTIPKGTILPSGVILSKTQSVAVNVDFLFMIANPVHSGLVKAAFLDILSRGEFISGSPWTMRPSHVSRQDSLASTTCAGSQSSFNCSFRLEKLGGNQRYFEYKVQANVNAQGKATYVTNRLGSGEVIFDMRFRRYNFSLPFTPGRGFIIQTDELGRIFLIVEREGILFRGPFQLAALIKGQPRPWRRDGRNFFVRLADGSTMIFDVNDGSIFTTPI